MTTVLDCINAGTAYLEKRGVEDARRNMQWLVAHHLQCSRMDLYLRFDEPLDEATLAPLRLDLKKRGERIPLQHLLGKVAFYHHEFHVDARALIPRPETEELVTWLIDSLHPAPIKVLDLGCGSGAIGLSLAAAWPDAQVVLADVSCAALELSQENARQLNIKNINFIESSLFSHLPDSFDLIVANLPYIPESERATLQPEVQHDPALALFSGPDGLDLIRQFCQEVSHHLAPGGSVAMEVGYDQGATVASLLAAQGLHEVQVMKDISGIARFPLAKMPASSNSVGTAASL